MGQLRYGAERFEFDDRLLAHLQIVISSKLRRSESFFLSWLAHTEAGSGRHAIWIDTGVPIHITYFGSRPPSINRQWVEDLALAANSTAGLVLMDEPTVPMPHVQSEGR
jgi:hypothetical protein